MTELLACCPRGRPSAAGGGLRHGELAAVRDGHLDDGEAERVEGLLAHAAQRDDLRAARAVGPGGSLAVCVCVGLLVLRVRRRSLLEVSRVNRAGNSRPS